MIHLINVTPSHNVSRQISSAIHQGLSLVLQHVTALNNTVAERAEQIKTPPLDRQHNNSTESEDFTSGFNIGLSSVLIAVIGAGAIYVFIKEYRLAKKNERRAIIDDLQRSLAVINLIPHHDAGQRDGHQHTELYAIILNHITRAAHLFEQHPNLMLSHNPEFIQMITQGMQFDNADCRQQLQQLYSSYLGRKAIKPFTALEDFGGYGSYTVDWNDEHAANYILLPTSSDGPIMLCSANSLQGMYNPDPLHPTWNNHYLFDRQGTALLPADYPTETLLRSHFPYLSLFYQQQKQPSLFDKLLDTLQLDAMRTLFVTASRNTSCRVKLVTLNEQQQLSKIFNRLINHSEVQDSYQLTEKHTNDILAVYDLTSASNRDKAETFLSLAAVFTQYSSRNIFGTDEDSPEIIRSYADALMEQAFVLEPALFQGKIDDWRSCLLGLNKAYSCSGLLANDLKEYGKQHFPHRLAVILPPVWT